MAATAWVILAWLRGLRKERMAACIRVGRALNAVGRRAGFAGAAVVVVMVLLVVSMGCCCCVLVCGGEWGAVHV